MEKPDRDGGTFMAVAGELLTACKNRAARSQSISDQSRRSSTSLRRFGESIPDRLRPRRACFRFPSLS